MAQIDSHREGSGGAWDGHIVTAVLTVMCWVARCDGPISHKKAALIIGASIRRSRDPLWRRMVLCVPRTLWDCEDICYADLLAACRTVTSLPEATREWVLGTVVDIGFADGVPGPAGNHALRLIADLCDQTGRAEYLLAREFERHGFRIRAPGDPTSMGWWESRGERDWAHRTERSMVTARGLRELQDLAALGLGPGACDEDIKRAFRESARQCHPDRFHTMPQGEQERAMVQFQRLRDAYERLCPQ
jgi:hypothetical protein